MDFFDLNLIFDVLDNIVKEYSNVNLHDNGSYPGYDPEDSCLYIDDNGELVWARFIGTQYEGAFKVKDCDEDELKILLGLLLKNKIISKDIYNFLTCEDENYIDIDNLLKQLLDYKLLSKAAYDYFIREKEEIQTEEED